MGQCCTDVTQLQLEGQTFDLKTNTKEFLPATLGKNDVAQLGRIKIEEVEIKIQQEERRQEELLQQEEQELKAQIVQKEENLDFHEFIHLYQKMVHFYKQHDLYVAHELSKEISALQDKIKQARQLNDQSFVEKLRLIQESWRKDTLKHKIQAYDSASAFRIQKEMKDVLFYQHQVEKAPFIQKYNDGDIKISTRKEETSIGALIQTQLHVPFQYFAAIMTEVQYFPDLVPFCEESVVIDQTSRNSKMGHMILNFPMIARRQAYFQGYAYFRFKHHRDIFVYTRSIHDKPHLQKQFDISATLNKDYVPLDYKYFMLTYEPLREGAGKLKFAFNIDNGVHFLPEFIEDYITRQFGKRLFQNILSISKKFRGSKWEKRMAQRPQLFIFIRQKIKQQLQFLKSQVKHL